MPRWHPAMMTQLMSVVRITPSFCHRLPDVMASAAATLIRPYFRKRRTRSKSSAMDTLGNPPNESNKDFFRNNVWSP